jgi:hypothetical protein
MWRLALVLAFACSNSSKPVEPPSNGSAKGSAAGSGSAAKYDGPPGYGPCESAHDCTLRDVCGCSCEGVLASAPKGVACDESCPPSNICDKFTVICDLSQHRCSAIPKSP